MAWQIARPAITAPIASATSQRPARRAGGRGPAHARRRNHRAARRGERRGRTATVGSLRHALAAASRTRARGVRTEHTGSILTVGEKTMSFALYMIGFLIFLGGRGLGRLGGRRADALHRHRRLDPAGHRHLQRRGAHAQQGSFVGRTARQRGGSRPGVGCADQVRRKDHHLEDGSRSAPAARRHQPKHRATYYARTRRNSSLFICRRTDSSVAARFGSHCSVRHSAARHVNQRKLK